ncbi:DUF2281 domain-containing protein [Clostridium botulinum]|uniref:DUF2281 domain-containing protein n=2 Tax=Clostridium botulinum TaxID=1491 RepID=A0A9Q1UYD7_CLOBO|nr:DUF2281 domain-containing protein [Clostridium botulinum]AEB76005.1 hypothetical protein CbC4_1325 [Clostridium botulinum BKT015925]KEI02676.1 hypothetical protein Z953_06415 [Clostridium botulinum D str. 16868]KEI03978.1 hypothetical protein Y848_03780 [Clostridium botulinum C/D str. Sp77]KEI04426.1 hypothetical protein Z952_07105 [Clostridium botulinum C/D str. BKT75002]KEI11335.1 hypothetical protein Z954_08590 [Clostridium botulinum C/D str. BKT2873]
MINKEGLVKKIETLPPYLLQEVADYIDFIEFKKNKKNNFKIEDITLASEKSLAKEWLKPEEDETWKDL